MKKASLMKKCEPHLLQENVKSYENEKTLKCSLIPDICNSEHFKAMGCRTRIFKIYQVSLKLYF